MPIVLKYIAIVVVLVCLLVDLFIRYHPTTVGSRNVIVSEKLMNTIFLLAGFPKESAKASAPFPPVIILRRKDHPMNTTRIIHEHIHHVQMIESLFLAQIRSFGEYHYAKRILGKSNMEAYLRKATEQEAYLNQLNPDYLRTRKPRAIVHYIRHKKLFHLENYQVVFDE